MHLIGILVFLSLLNVTVACEDYSECPLPDGHVGMCYNKTCLRQVEDAHRENLTFTIVVKYPQSVLQKHKRTTLYIRGNGLCLFWNKGKRLSKTGYDTWGMNITYESILTRYLCKTCSNQGYLPDNKLQYRILADDRDDMLGANFVINFPISKTSSYFDKKPVFTSYPWFYAKTGNISTFLINSTYIGHGRNVTFYTPPSFHENTYKTYPTIFVLDLNLQNAKFFKRNLEGPIYPYAVSEEYVLIGFGDYRSAQDRMNLLAPSPGPFAFCINGTFDNSCGGCIPPDITVTGRTREFFEYLFGVCGERSIVGGLSDDTLNFLEKEVLPFANNLTSERLQTSNLGIMGYSLGGLFACHAIWTRPRVYSSAACQAAAFLWPISNSSIFDAEFDFINKTLRDPLYQTNRPKQKIYLDAGGNEFMGLWNYTQSTVETANIITGFEHYKLDGNVWVHVHPLIVHNSIEWGKRMGQALATLLPAGGAPTITSKSFALVDLTKKNYKPTII